MADRRMSDVEALMWNLEKDPHLASWFANVTVLDRPPDVDRLRQRLSDALVAVPRLRQRVVPGLGRLAPPEWQDDPNFDLDYHVRRVGLPAPAGERELLDLAATLASVPFDRTRPLWEFTIIDNLAGDDGGHRGAMIQKIHHTITDGEGGVRMSAQFIDLSRDADEAIAGPPRRTETGDASAPEPPANIVSSLTTSAGHTARRLLGAGRRTAAETLVTARHPSRIPTLVGVAGDIAQSVGRQLLVTDRARSPLWSERSLRRRLEVLRVPLDDAKRAAKSMGGSVNDLFVTGAAAAAGEYHRARGVEVDLLRIAMPVSTRSDENRRSAGGNAFAPSRVLVPAGPMDVDQRFAAVQAILGVTKRERALGLAASLAGVMNLVPTSVQVRLARQQTETVDFTTSNVRGAPFDLFIAGARIEANYPMGPTGGTAFNLTTLSSAGWLDMGCNIDTAAVDDPDELRQHLEAAYRELLAAG